MTETVVTGEKIKINISTMLNVAKRLETKIKEEQEVVDLLVSLTKAKGLENALASTNASLEKDINAGKLKIEEINANIKKIELETAKAKEISEAKIADVKLREEKAIRELEAKTKAKIDDCVLRVKAAETDEKLRVKKAEERALKAEQMAAIAEQKKAEAESAFNSLKEKVLA